LLHITNISEALPRKVASANRLVRPLSAITKIVVHYDGVHVPESGAYDPVRRYAEQARYHMSKNWNDGAGPVVKGFGLMYHYRVAAGGQVWQTQPEKLITWHARAANRSGLAICCDLGPGQRPPQAQLDGLRALLDHLCYHRPDFPASRPDVYGHGELTAAGNATPCPGTLLAWVRAYRKG
jgi:hypothetical protein